MASLLQNAANIAVVLKSIAVLWSVWRRTQVPSPDSPPTDAIGERIEAVAGQRLIGPIMFGKDPRNTDYRPSLTVPASVLNSACQLGLVWLVERASQ